jgi:hypothetical protein
VRAARAGLRVALLGLLAACARPAPLGPPVPPLEGPPGVVTVRADRGPLEARLGPVEPSSALILTYGGEARGELGPCGCAETPRGGLPRRAAVEAALAARHGVDGVLRVHLGGQLDPGRGIDGAPTPVAAAANPWMLRGLAATAPAVIALTAPDLDALRAVAEAPALPWVSAHLRGPGVETERVLTVNGVRVGVTALSTRLPVAGSEGLGPEPVRAAEAAVARLRPGVDLVVLLSTGAPELARAVVRQGGVDLVIDAAHHTQVEAPFFVDGALWVRAPDRTSRLGVLALDLENGRIVAARERRVALDAEVGHDPSVHRLQAGWESAVLAAQTVRISSPL